MHLATPETAHLFWTPNWQSWSRSCATSRKVAGSIPHGPIGIYRF